MSSEYDKVGDEGDAWGSKEVQVPGYNLYGIPSTGVSGMGQTPVWQTRTVDEAVINYIGLVAAGDPRANVITQSLINSGVVNPNANIIQLESGYRKALIMTAKVNETNKGFDVFQAMQAIGKPDGGGSGSGGTYKDVMRYTDEQVKQKAIDAYMSILGMTPNDAEIAEFARALRAGAAAAPSVQKVSAGGKMRETTQGFDERAFVAGYMANKVPDASGDLSGAAGGIQDIIENYRQNYGINPTAAFVQDSIRRIVSAADPNAARADLEAQLKEQAMTLYPALKDKIEAGFSVRAIADPYIATYAKLMEQSDMSVGLNNQYVNMALSNKNEKGEYQIMDRDQFARKIRSSEEWLNTRNAKETMLSAADGILKQFGFKR